MTQIIVGIDCASKEKNIGLALGVIENRTLKLRGMVQGGRGQGVVDLIIRWLPPDQPVLLALDAPLGWPAPMGAELADHIAGMPLKAQPNDFFSRYTDRFVRKRLGKRPLEVGANLIARTAHAALRLLDELRLATGLAIPLVWSPNELVETSVIEVYPALTMLGRGLDTKNYKKLRAQAARKRLVEALAEYIEIDIPSEWVVLNSHTLDAAICVLGGYDFLTGKCILPADLDLARKEGWIWIKDPKKN